MPRPALEDYTDHRKYIVDTLAAEGLSQSELAKHLGLSESMVSLVLKGERRFKHVHVQPLAQLVGLAESQRRYLHALIDLENESPIARNAAWVTIQATQRRLRAERPSDDTLAALADWHVGVVQELAACAGFNPNPRWLAQTTDPPISEAQAEEAIRVLLALGELEPDEEGGLRPSRPDHLTEPDMGPGVASVAAAKLHRQALELAGRSLEAFVSGDRHLSTMVFALPEDRWTQVLGRLREIETELLHLATQPGGADPNRVYVLAFQMFPASLYTDLDHEEPGPEEAGEDSVTEGT